MFKVWVKTTGDTTWSTNGVAHPTAEDASEAAENLFMRWFAVEKWAVLPMSDVLAGHLFDEVIDDLAVKRS